MSVARVVTGACQQPKRKAMISPPKYNIAKGFSIGNIPKTIRFSGKNCEHLSNTLMQKVIWMIIFVPHSVQLEPLDIFMCTQWGVKNKQSVIFLCSVLIHPMLEEHSISITVQEQERKFILYCVEG